MAEAKQGDTVKVHYTGQFEDGTVFDSSADRDPLEFTIGAGHVIPGFEQAVVGMSPGDTKRQTIPSENGYGSHNPDMVITVERQQLPAGLNPEIGQELQLMQQNGQPIPVVVTDVNDSTITIDANHPLAGQTLVFDIELVEISGRNGNA